MRRLSVCAMRFSLAAMVMMGSMGAAYAEDKLLASDGDVDDYFGRSVAISGQTIVVGAQQDDELGTNAGAAYVWVKSGNAWAQAQKLTAFDGAPFDGFGHRVAISDDIIVVGAPFHNSGAVASGAAYVFVPDNVGGWLMAAQLTASDGGVVDEFGWSVAIDDDLIVVGARWDDEAGANAGAAYVYERPPLGWTDTTETAKLMATDGAAGDEFGLRVAVSAGAVVVAAPKDDDGCGQLTPDCNTGSAYVFEGAGAFWTEVAKLTSPDPVGGDWFGRSVAIEDDLVVVGAPFHVHDGFYSGSAYVYERPGTGWGSTSVADTELISSDPTGSLQSDGFGFWVAGSGRGVGVGAGSDDDACGAVDNCNSGSLYTYTRPGSGWASIETETDKVTASDAERGDIFGVSAAVDGNTLVVGAGSEDEQGSNAGAAYVYLVTPAGLPGSASQPHPNASLHR